MNHRDRTPGQPRLTRRSRRGVALAFALGLGLALGGATASPGAEVRAAGARVLHEPDLAAYARYTAERYPGFRDRIERKLGLPLPDEITIEWVADHEGFDAAVAARRRGRPAPLERWVAGVALHPEQVIVIRASSLEFGNRAELDALLLHEIAHLALAAIRHPDSRPQPVWLHEGLAQWAAGRLVFDHRFQLELARRTGQLLSFAHLESEFPADAAGAALAYQQSESMIRFLVNRHGAARVRSVLRRMAGGETFYVAFYAETGEGFYDLEDDWKEFIGQTPFLLWLASRGSLLFGGLALVGLVGAWFRWRRARKIKSQWDQEEKAEEAEEDRLDARLPERGPGTGPTNPV